MKIYNRIKKKDKTIEVIGKYLIVENVSEDILRKQKQKKKKRNRRRRKTRQREKRGKFKERNLQRQRLKDKRLDIPPRYAALCTGIVFSILCISHSSKT